MRYQVVEDRARTAGSSNSSREVARSMIFVFPEFNVSVKAFWFVRKGVENHIEATSIDCS